MLKLELGGGTKPRGDGWVNVDQTPNADVKHDLNVYPWPFADDAADEMYSSHCLEHLREPLKVLWEIARIGKIGCPVELHVPHPQSDLAMVDSHVHVFSPIQAVNMDVHFPREFWPHAKRLKLERHEFAASFLLEQAKRELPFLAGLDDQVIMRYFGATAHETIFHYCVVENEFFNEHYGV